MASRPASALMPHAGPSLEVRDLDVCVAGRRLVGGLSLQVHPGQMVCLLGANGAGKSLTLHTLAGLRPASRGDVILNGKPLAQWPRRERALRVGLLTQVSEDPFPGTVMEAVLVGRHPHVQTWQWESPSDLEVARKALADCDLQGFESRDLDTLSGGERRRVALASVLAQDPDLLLLDEPQNHLDPRHQLAVLRLLRARADAGKSVIVSLHDASLAGRFGDQALLLNGDGRWSFGAAQTTLTATLLSDLYGMEISEVTLNGQRHFLSQ